MCYVYFGASATLRGSNFGQYKFLAPLISAQIANCCSSVWEALQFETFTSHLQADVCFLFSKGWRMACVSDWTLKVWELQVFRTSQDTNTEIPGTFNATGKLRSLWLVLLVVGFGVDGREEAVVKWCHLLSHSFPYFKSGRSVLKRVTILQQQRSTWGGTGSPTTAWQPETLIRQIERRNPKLSATRFN